MISRCYGGVGRPPRRQRRHSIERSPEKSGGDWATPSACLTPTTSATRWLSSGRSSTVSHRRRCGRPAPRLGLHRRGGRPTAPDGLRLRLRHGSPLPAEHGVALARRSPGGKGTKQWANSGASSVTRSCRPVFPWWAWPRSERGCDWSSSSSLGPRPGLDPQDPEHEPGRALSQPEVQGPGRGARAERRAGGNSGVVGDIDTSRDGGRLRLSVGRTRPGADPVATGEVEWGGAKSSGRNLIACQCPCVRRIRVSQTTPGAGSDRVRTVSRVVQSTTVARRGGGGGGRPGRRRWDDDVA